MIVVVAVMVLMAVVILFTALQPLITDREEERGTDET